MLIQRKTIFSNCRKYRYVLWRDWDDANQNYAMFIGLNPSTANEANDDPTIRRCVNFAKDWGYGALCMVNLFAYRTTEPKILKMQREPVGLDNDRWLRRIGNNAGVIVAAWGVHGTHLMRDRDVIRLFRGKLTCLAVTKDGHPRHPLYLRQKLKPVPFA